MAEQVDERLRRLIQTDICKAEDASKYAEELRRLAETVVDAETLKAAAGFFKALAEEKRLSILKLLIIREMCVCELTIALGMTQPNASHHLGILESAGLVARRKEGKWTYYSIKDRERVENLLQFIRY
ncbi:ArsR family transcriptional regulator [Candidatus Bathyarchaeota archaeon]|nr:MAG: ArsR family transcriptional regulator [Candidatus Bathyarchaeota archaeon]